MAKLRIIVTLMVIAALTACSDYSNGISKQDVGTVAGGVAGGVIGSQLFHGDSQVFGAVGGAILGSLVGSSIGKSMDQQDRVNTTQALISTPIGQEAAWTNSRTGTSYIVRPVNDYRSGNQYCRRAKVYIDNGRNVAYTTVCRGSDGRWYLQSR